MRKFVICLLILGAIGWVLPGEIPWDVEEILDKIRVIPKDYKACRMDFYLKGEGEYLTPESKGEFPTTEIEWKRETPKLTISGFAICDGKRFRIEVGKDIQIICNGKKFWVYDKVANLYYEEDIKIVADELFYSLTGKFPPFDGHINLKEALEREASWKDWKGNFLFPYVHSEEEDVGEREAKALILENDSGTLTYKYLFDEQDYIFLGFISRSDWTLSKDEERIEITKISPLKPQPSSLFTFIPPKGAKKTKRFLGEFLGHTLIKRFPSHSLFHPTPTLPLYRFLTFLVFPLLH